MDASGSLFDLDPPNVPVTSLLCLEDALLSGEGSFLNIYFLNNNTKLCVKIFTTSNIHGITKNPYSSSCMPQLCFFGSRFYRVVTFDEKFKVIDSTPEKQMTYWISDICWVSESFSNSSMFLVLYFSNNSLALIDYTSLQVIGHIQCQESCILYSARVLFHDHWKGLVALGGTVFNQVVIWSVEMSSFLDKSFPSAPVLHRLTGHKGVISGLDWNPERCELCSVSDDRSIRVWRMLPSGASRENTPIKTCDFETWKTCQFQQSLVLYGHAARVWRARLLQNCIISVGEDAVCAVWSYDGHMLQKFAGHKGKNIWSLDVNENKEEIYTGGGDGGIRIWKFSSSSSLNSNSPQEDTFTKTLEPPLTQEKDFPRIIRIVGESKVIMMSDRGSLIIYDVISDSWNLAMNNSKYSSYSLLEVNDDFAAVANIQGWVLLLQINGMSASILLEKKLCDGKIHSINWLSHYEFLTTGPNGDIIIWRIDIDSTAASLTEVSQHFLPLASQRWVSAASLLPSSDVLVCGDRVGSVHVYHFPSSHNESFPPPVKSFPKVFGSLGVTFVSCHNNQVYCCGRNGQVHVYEGSSADDFNLLHVFNVYKGFDWLSRIIFTEEDQLIIGFLSNKFVVFSVYTNQFLVSFSCGGGHRTWDFIISNNLLKFTLIKQRKFILYQDHLKTQKSVIKPSLHGLETTCILHLGSRNLSNGVRDMILTSGEDGIIDYISLHSCSENFNSATTRKNTSAYDVTSVKGHTSGIKSMSAISMKQTTLNGDTCPQSSTNLLLFTAGAGGIVKSWNLKISSSHAKKADNPETRDGGSLMSNGGKEMDVSEELIDGLSVSSSQKMWLKLLSHHMLADKNKKGKKPWRNYEVNEMLEARYVTLDVMPASEFLSNSHLKDFAIVFAGCSLGFVRLFLYNMCSNEFELLNEFDFHEHCILKVKCFVHKNSHSGIKDLCLLSAATDGRVAFWLLSDVKNYLETFADVNQERMSSNLGSENISKPVCVFQSHQSGVNALDVISLPDTDIYLIATGGDDNCLTLAAFNFSNYSVGHHSKHPCAHSSQITGVAFLTEKYFLSVSIDQRLVLWQINILEPLEMVMVKSVMLDVSDISDMLVVNYPQRNAHDKYGIFVVGTGMQRILLDLTSLEENLTKLQIS